MIEVKEGVYWDEESNVQSEEAMQWLRESVRPKMACSPADEGKTQPTYDRYGRPCVWVIAVDGCVVTITREYVSVNTSSWAMRRDIVNVTKED